MVSSLLSTVCLQRAEGISIGTAWFLYCCAPSSAADSVHLFGSLDRIFNGRFLGQAGPPK